MDNFDWNDVIVTSDADIVNAQVMDRMILVTGEKGDSGGDGRSVLSIDKTAQSPTRDVYTIFYSDGTKTNFAIDKPIGRFIAGISKSTSGITDTYTIVYSDNTQYQFSVNNGAINSDAPADGKNYGRNNNSWREIVTTDNVYTKPQTDNFISGLQNQIDNINNFQIHICSSAEYDSATLLPVISNPDETTFYLVPTASGNDIYDEWIYLDGKWERFGAAKIDLTPYYTKTETDALLDEKAAQDDMESELALKADKATTYTKTEMDALLDEKADKATTYTKTETDELLTLKADKATTYTKTETDAFLDLKADKTTMESELDLKADKETTYTKTETDDLLALKQDNLTFDLIPTVGSTNPVISNGIKTELDSKADMIIITETGESLHIELAADNYLVKSLLADLSPQQSGEGKPSSTNIRPFNPLTKMSYDHVEKTYIVDIPYEVGSTNYLENSIDVYDYNLTANYNKTREILSLKVKNAKNINYTFADLIYFGLTPGKYILKYTTMRNIGGADVYIEEGSKTAQYEIVKKRLIKDGTSYWNEWIIDCSEGGNAWLSIRVSGNVSSDGECELSLHEITSEFYGGTYDITNGIFIKTKEYIESYNGETLPGAWLSDRDVYQEGTTPSIGAQVVYDLETPVDYEQISPREIRTVYGVNDFSSPEASNMTISYVADTKLYLDSLMKYVHQFNLHVCESEEYDHTTLAPKISNPADYTVYFVPTGEGNDLYDEWLYLNGQWEKIGFTENYLSKYASKDDLYIKSHYESSNGLIDIKRTNADEKINKAVFYYPASLTGVNFVDIWVMNKNLLNGRIFIESSTINGVDFQVNADGSITFSGTPTDIIDVKVAETPILPIGKYILSGGVDSNCVLLTNPDFAISSGGDQKFDLDIDSTLAIHMHIYNTGTPVSGTFYPMIRLSTSEGTYIEPIFLYNRSPYSGYMGNYFTGGTLYGGWYDIVENKLYATHAHVINYNGFTLPGKWISDRDEYVEGTKPSIGASVTYELAEPEVAELRDKRTYYFYDEETVFLSSRLTDQFTIDTEKISFEEYLLKLQNEKSDISSLGTMATQDDAPSDNIEYVRKNGAWAVSSGGGGGSVSGAVWGTIAGTLSQQTDLQNALNAKANQSTTYTKTEVNNLLDEKQNELTFDNTPTANSDKPVKSGGIKTALDAKADATSVYTKAESDAILADKANTADLGDLAMLDNVDFTTQVTNKPTAYPPVVHNHDDRYYTETEVDTFVDGLQDQIDNINNFAIHICSSTEYDETTHIPTIVNPNETTFYLVPNGTGNDVYDEYIYTNNAWEKFGSASIDLAQYYTKTQTDNLLSVKANESIVANEWSNVKAYNIGDVVIYNHELYKFTENVIPKVETYTIQDVNSKYHYQKDELFIYENTVYKVLTEFENNREFPFDYFLSEGYIEVFDVPNYVSGETYQVGDIVKVDDEYYIVTIAGSPTELNPSAVSKINIDTLLDEKQNTLTFDNTPTAGSNNPVTSGGVKTALDAKQNSLIFDTTPTANSINPVQSGGIKTALDAKQNTLTFDTAPTSGSTNPVTSGGIKTALDAKQNTLPAYDTTPTAGSTNIVTSGGIKTALDTKQNTLTFDSTPTANSSNPVKSSGIKTALDGKTNLNQIASEFSTSKAYAIDDLVIYQGALYRFTTTHAAGAWNAAHVTACTIAEVMSHFAKFRITGTVSSGNMTLTDARIDSEHWRVPNGGIYFETPRNVTTEVNWSTNITEHTITLSATYTASTSVIVELEWMQN